MRLRVLGIRVGSIRRPLIGLGVTVAALVLGCAYYNIFWTAEHEYEKAIEGTTIADFWDPYSQPKASGETLKNVDSCIKRTGKILLLYPKSKWVDDAMIIMGNCFLIKGDYPDALRKYEEILRLYSTSEFAPQASYMKAYTLVLQGSPEEALAWLAEGPKPERGEWLERSLLLQARIYEEQGECEQAIPRFQDYLARFPEGHRATDATLALGECLIRVGKQTEALTLLEPLAKRADLAGALASLRLGRAYRDLGDDKAALGIFEHLFDVASADSVRARALIEKAITLDKEANCEEAVRVLSLADSLGKGTLGGEAQYRMGLICERGLSDLENATKAYTEAAKGTSKFSDLAQKRLVALRALDSYEKSLADTTVQSVDSQAMNRFLLAGTYLLDLGSTGKALDQYRIVADSLPANPYTARAKLAVGGLLDSQGDSILAGFYYRAVADSFPGTIYANMARSRLGLPLEDVAVAHPDTVSADSLGASLMGPPAPVELGGQVGPGAGSMGAPADTSAGKSAGTVSPNESTYVEPSRRAMPPFERGVPDSTSPGRFPPGFPRGTDVGDTTRWIDSTGTVPDTTGPYRTE